MKRILALVLAFFIAGGCVFAKQDKIVMPSVKLDGTKYTLMYSAKSSETGGFINEYYKQNQTYASWNELVGVHHYPTAFYPIEHAKEFSDYLNASGVQANMEVYDEENTALLYFIIIDNSKLPIIMEFNVFKYVKSPVCGTVAFQYAKRYRLNSSLEINKTKKEFVKNSLKYIKRVSKFDVPDVITAEVDKGQYVHPEDIPVAEPKLKKEKKDKKIKKEQKQTEAIVKDEDTKLEKQPEKNEEVTKETDTKSAEEENKEEENTQKDEVKSESSEEQ